MKINGIDIMHYSCVESTNEIALNISNPGDYLTVISDTQTGGRGRMDRKFFSYDGGLYMSVCIPFERINTPFHLITPSAAIAVSETLEHFGVKNIKIKWVNDLLIDNRKICGILTQAKSCNGKIERVVVGIGINLTKPENDFPDEIKNRAGYADYKGDKLTLAAEIGNNLRNLLYLTQEKIVSKYKQNMAYIGEIMQVTDYSDNNKKVLGKIIGVNDDCFLRIMTEDGKEKIISSGEVL